MSAVGRLLVRPGVREGLLLQAPSSFTWVSAAASKWSLYFRPHPLPVHLQDKLKGNLIGLQSSGPVGTSLNSPASTLCLAHLVLATLASLFLEKARQIPASDSPLFPQIPTYTTCSLVSFVFAPLSLG